MKKEIKHIHTPGFKTPSNYFDNVEENVMTEIGLAKNLSKKSPFLTPSSYFDSLEDKILEKVVSEKEQPKVISLFQNNVFKYVASIAAIGIILFSVFNIPGEETLDFSSIESSQISYYVEQGYISLSDFELESLISEQALSNDNPLLNTDISKEELLDYLANDMDLSTYMYED